MINKRKLHLDILRIIAAFFVIFNHTAGFSLFNDYLPDSKSYWVFLAFSILCKISVPVFFMISGALLLNKENEKPSRLLLRALRIVIVLVFFSFLSYLQQIHLGYETFDLHRFFQVLIQSDWLNVYWYLYAYLAFLLCLPFLRIFAKGFTTGHFLYLVSLHVFFLGIVPVIIQHILKLDLSINSQFSFGWLLGNVPIYPLVGHYLENKLDINRFNWKKMTLLWICTVLCVILTSYATYLNNVETGGFPQHYMMSLLIIPCITVYITAKKLCSGWNIKWLSTVISSVGGCTFGIYLLHGQLLREPNARLLSRLANHIALHPMLFHLFVCLDVMFIAFVIIWILRRIPFVKKLI